MNLPLYAKIDLTSGTWEPYTIPEDVFKKYIGGKALAAWLLLTMTPPGIDPFAAESMVVVNTGPVSCTGAPCSSRFNLSSKNVLTGGIASSNCGGTFGMMMRKAGFEGLILTGISPAPRYLEFADGQVLFRDAEALWGLDTEQAQEATPKHYGKLMIGPAGENLVRYAGLASGERMAGRCGIGAIFGSKKLKGLIAYGTKEFPAPNPDAFYRYLGKWTKFLRGHAMTGDALPHYGSAGLVNKANASHALPTRNFQTGHDPEADAVSGETLADTRLTRNGNCVSCPIRCERRVKLGKKEIKGPEYETLGLFGPNIALHDLDLVIRLNYLCDLLGLDTISCASTMAFAMELYENGVADFGLRFGKGDNLEEVITKIAHREGIYSDLANGSKWMSEQYGGKEYAIHAKGLELAAYEPRRSVGMGLGYATSNRGGCHLNGGYGALVESVGVLSIRPNSPLAKPQWVVFLQNALEGISTCGFCLFSGQTFIPSILFKLGPHHPVVRVVGFAASFTGPVIRLLLAATPLMKLNTVYLLPQAKVMGLAVGMKYDMGNLIDLGNRTYNAEHIYNLREGVCEDTLPDRLTRQRQKKDDPTTVVPLDRMLPVYYRTRGWNNDGTPKRRMLKRLGMEELWPQ